MCSALATTRRSQSQPPFFVFFVLYWNSVKTRAGLPVWFHCCVAACICCPDDSPQSLIARQTEHIVHAIVFAPVHQLVAAETGIAAQYDLHFRPCRPNLRHDAPDLRQTAEGGIMVGFPQPRAKNVFAAEDVQRQIAVVVVVSVKEASFLLAVQRQVRGVHIQHDLGWCASGGPR